MGSGSSCSRRSTSFSFLRILWTHPMAPAGMARMYGACASAYAAGSAVHHERLRGVPRHVLRKELGARLLGLAGEAAGVQHVDVERRRGSKPW